MVISMFFSFFCCFLNVQSSQAVRRLTGGGGPIPLCCSILGALWRESMAAWRKWKHLWGNERMQRAADLLLRLCLFYFFFPFLFFWYRQISPHCFSVKRKGKKSNAHHLRNEFIEVSVFFSPLVSV